MCIIFDEKTFGNLTSDTEIFLKLYNQSFLDDMRLVVPVSRIQFSV